MDTVTPKNIPRVVLSVPPGIEVACIKIARRETGLMFEKLSNGLIVSKKKPKQDTYGLIEDAPLWSFGSFHLASTRSLSEQDESILEDLRALVSDRSLTGQNYWLTCDNSEPDRIQKLKSVILKNDVGLKNDPSDYTQTIKLSSDGNRAIVLIGPSISVKQRFSYRAKDVEGSINPVLAACLVRLMPAQLTGLTVDPTCGSGTLLFERLRYAVGSNGLGMDINPDVQAAFSENLSLCNHLSTEARFLQADAKDAQHWEPCTSVVANLPFGIRLKDSPANLERLYSDIMRNALDRLAPDGRILLTSSFKRGLETAVQKSGDKAKLLSRYRTEIGGLFYHVIVVGKLG